LRILLTPFHELLSKISCSTNKSRRTRAGNHWPWLKENGALAAPGIARIDIVPSSKQGCWEISRPARSENFFQIPGSGFAESALPNLGSTHLWNATFIDFRMRACPGRAPGRLSP